MAQNPDKKAADKAAKKEINAIIKKYRPKWHQRVSHAQVTLGMSSTMTAIGAALGTAAVMDPTGTSGVGYFMVTGWFALNARDDLKSHKNKVYKNSANQNIQGNSKLCTALFHMDFMMQSLYEGYERCGDVEKVALFEKMQELETDIKTLTKHMSIIDADGKKISADGYAFCLNKEAVLDSLGRKEHVAPKSFVDLKQAFGQAQLPKPTETQRPTAQQKQTQKQPKKLGR